MNICITGGAGYVGTSLTQLLLSKGFQVRVMDNLMFGSDPLLPFFRNENFEFMKGDVRNVSDVENAVKGQDVIIHLAAIVGYPACRKDPGLAEEVNINGIKNVSKAVSKNQIVLFASTGSNYGAVEDMCSEETPLNPLSLYAQTKVIGEKIVSDNPSGIIFRFATGFGISARFRLDLLINDFVHKAVTQGYMVIYEKNFKRSFIHVHDMARAFLFGIEHADNMVGQVYNIGSETMNYTKEEICDIIKSKINCYIHYADVGEDTDKRNYRVSYQKINSLGFETTVSLHDGIDELAKASRILFTKTPY
ncbi:MAG: NAD(P)-dependent oxidoreductase, partial [Candidatus Sungbacteria bacterium]|nr:NAD(P)-dependent oxidoreductase [Candidatus Sungbacteria bacterium]